MTAAKKTKKTKKPVKRAAKRFRMVLVGNSSYGLYVGITSATDAQILKNKSVRLTQCRHVARWYGKTGGVTSLAAHGPCGPSAAQSRVGAPCDALVTSVVNVFDLTAEAMAAFAAIAPQ
jgi:hypothetical protein